MKFDYIQLANSIACSYCNISCMPPEAEGVMILFAEELTKYYESLENGSANVKSVRDLNSEVGFHKYSLNDIFKTYYKLLDPHRKLECMQVRHC